MASSTLSVQDSVLQHHISDKSLNQHNTLNTAEKGHIYQWVFFNINVELQEKVEKMKNIAQISVEFMSKDLLG